MVLNKDKKIIIFCNEAFGACNTPRGGYGFLARYLFPQAVNIPLSNITICLGRSKNLFSSIRYRTDDGINIIRLPKIRYLAAKIVNEFDVIISIEATVDYLFSLKRFLNKKILFWIQDPRPKKDWREINTVQLAKEPSYWNDKTYDLVKQCFDLGLIKFVTQAKCLREKAVELYGLNGNVKIDFLPNPIPIKNDDYTETKKDKIIFLGRLDSVKRGWLFCEIAKQMPEYNFYVLGSSSNDREKKSNSIIDRYNGLKNLHFLGHLEGEKKEKYLKEAKILVNTSIHEALPVSFLEAFSYNVCVVSNQNPDNLVSRFGGYVGPSLGDGWDDVCKYISAIKNIMSNENIRINMAREAKKYVTSNHSHEEFLKIFNNVILDL